MSLVKLTFMPFFLKINLMDDTSLYINLERFKNNNQPQTSLTKINSILMPKVYSAICLQGEAT